MSPAGHRIYRGLLGFAAGACILSTTLLAQNQTRPGSSPPAADSEPVLRQLLAEVHQLRLALQQSALLSTRFQLAIERMRLQQTHVLALNRELSDLRETIPAKETELGNLVERRKSAEEEMGRAVGTEREGLEATVRILKAATASLDHEIQEARTRETDLAARLQNEQSRLEALDRDLDDLTKELKDP
jgi:predicted  nucleic acid-binding Zn-ribbon protein